jgi:isopentenyl diphosphate isomerase/L-lactate dehydrogenase-like FMN-dependent dehydrogenase
MRANLAAFARWEIVPRMLRDVSSRDLSTSILGTALPAPVLLAPVGVQSIVHPEAELAVGRAAGALGVPAILSTAASHSMEQVAEAMGEAARWYQLYWPRDRELAASFVARAGEAGYGAIVVTLDTWMLGWRPRDLRGAYLPFLKGEGVANYFSDPVFRAALERPPEEDPGPAIGHWALQFANPTVTWADLAWLREQTALPIVLKGILHPEDALRALECGVDGLIVSNHGGRQVDGSIGALDALPAVREAVGGEAPVLFDSGIRTGADVFKALALGADAVCLGRPFVWGLALAGQAGVEHVLRCLLAELDLTLALSGYTAPSQLDPLALRRAG